MEFGADFPLVHFGEVSENYGRYKLTKALHVASIYNASSAAELSDDTRWRLQSHKAENALLEVRDRYPPPPSSYTSPSHRFAHRLPEFSFWAESKP
jgi:hypothetical protein